MRSKLIICLVSLLLFINLQAQKKNASSLPEPEYMNQFYFMADSNKLVSLDKEKANMKTKAKLGGFGGSSSAYVMEGTTSSVRFHNNRPSFAVKMESMMMDPSGAIKLYKFESKNKNRESVISKSGFRGKQTGSLEGIGFLIKKTSNGVYVISAEEPLEPGEYGFINIMMPVSSGTSYSYTAYAFAID